MDDTGYTDVLAPALAGALTARGFTALTLVQRAVLDPGASSRDLRITSQTGSGKTVAVGLVLEPILSGGTEWPRALVIAPTRELARQFQAELSWLYASVRVEGRPVRVAALTGGGSYRDDQRALAQRPDVVVGTPGRLIDHLQRGALDLKALRALVLDEADRMLDLGFRDELDAILARAPAERRTLLVSATFPDEVRQLADRSQRNPLHLEGTRLGAANTDIEHLIHVVDPRQKLDAIVNLLLAREDARTLVFVRTRADVTEIAAALAQAGLAVASLSGEMEQRERTRALAAFKRGTLRVLVATDVAARGLDVPEIDLVIHVEPPRDADAYTHRSGRTGRAGRKGTSALLVSPRELPSARRVLGLARIEARTEPVPAAAAIRRAQDERILATLTGEPAAPIEERTAALARRLIETGDLERIVARLLTRLGTGPVPREIRTFEERPVPRRGPPAGDHDWVPFQVSWGQRHGADPRRLLALVCRRGKITSQAVGAIRVGAMSSEIQIAGNVAATFADATRHPDPRDPRVKIRPHAHRPHGPAAPSARHARARSQ